MTQKEREMFHKLLDEYLDEPESIKEAGTRLLQQEIAEITEDGRVRRTLYRMIIRTGITAKED